MKILELKHSLLQAAVLVLICVLVTVPLMSQGYVLFFMGQLITMVYLAISLSLVFTYARILSFCQGTFFAVGAYVALHTVSAGPFGVPVALAGAAVVAAFCGALIGALLVRMERDENPIIATLIIATIALLAGNAFTTFTGGEDGLALRLPHAGLLGSTIPLGANSTIYYLAAIPLMGLLVLMWYLQPTTFWKVMRAVGENEIRAQQLGFNVRLRRLLVFTVSAGIAGLGGAYYAFWNLHVTTHLLDLTLSVNAILWAVVGGAGSIFGPLIGVVLVYPVTELVASFFRHVEIAVGAVLIIVALFFPFGIVGTLWSHGTRTRFLFPRLYLKRSVDSPRALPRQP